MFRRLTFCKPEVQASKEKLKQNRNKSNLQTARVHNIGRKTPCIHVFYVDDFPCVLFNIESIARWHIVEINNNNVHNYFDLKQFCCSDVLQFKI